MKIKKILNNNAVITLDGNNKEIILLGKALAYGKRTGDDIEMEKVSKTFDISVEESQKKLVNLLVDIPIEYIELADIILKKIKAELPVEIDDSLYLNLTDHIHTSIERYKEGIVLKNQMLFEIKHFYPKEFELGIWTTKLLETSYGIKMDESEAAFIAMHIVTSEIGNNIDQMYEITSFINAILNLVSEFFNTTFDEESLSYHRFVTHLKYFGLRIFKENNVSKSDPLHNDLLTIMKEKYTQPYLCVLKIAGFLEQKYNYFLEDEEILYLTIHVAKIVSDNKKGE